MTVAGKTPRMNTPGTRGNSRDILTVELGLLQRLDFADVHILHGVDALYCLEDFP